MLPAILQKVLKRLAMTWRPLINEANFLKRDGGGGGVSVSLGDLLYARMGFVYLTVLSEHFNVNVFFWARSLLTNDISAE